MQPHAPGVAARFLTVASPLWSRKDKTNHRKSVWYHRCVIAVIIPGSKLGTLRVVMFTVTMVTGHYGWFPLYYILDEVKFSFPLAHTLATSTTSLPMSPWLKVQKTRA